MGNAGEKAPAAGTQGLLDGDRRKEEGQEDLSWVRVRLAGNQEEQRVGSGGCVAGEAGGGGPGGGPWL